MKSFRNYRIAKLPNGCVDLSCFYLPFNSNRNCQVFLGVTHEKRTFEDRRKNTKA